MGYRQWHTGSGIQGVGYREWIQKVGYREWDTGSGTGSGTDKEWDKVSGIKGVEIQFMTYKWNRWSGT